MTMTEPGLRNIHVVTDKNTDRLNHLAADIVIDVLKSVPNPVLGLATGSTPLGLYKVLIEKSKQDAKLYDRWRAVTTFNLDEYVGLSPDHPQSYHYYMHEHVFKHLPIYKEYTYVPDGIGDVEENCRTYQARLWSRGWPDLQILGIGPNGHIGFNEPADDLKLDTHVTDLRQATREANSRFFDSLDEVPKQAITMGIGDILKAKRIVLLAFGESKQNALKTAFGGRVSTNCPASLLQLHPDVTIFTDQSI